jgi:hypothetical protein
MLLGMDVEMLSRQLRELVLEQQKLHERGAGTDELERNRLDIVRAQWRLSHALIQAHPPQAA